MLRAMYLKIVQVGEPVLRQYGRSLAPSEIVGPEMQRLIELMRETMRDAPGVGLAAPQIGLPLQLAVIEDVAESEGQDRKPVPFHVIVNPKLTLGAGDRRALRRVPQRRRVPGDCPARADRARRGAGSPGKPISIDATGWYARILQHEIDHLHGTLYIDRMHTRTFATSRNMQHWAGAKVADVLAALERPAP